MPSLRAVRASWKLPHWPEPSAMGRLMERSWAKWGLCSNLPSRLFWASMRSVSAAVARIPYPPLPREWGQQQLVMGTALAAGMVLAADDRDHGKAWQVKESELCMALLASILEDPHWRLRPELQPGQVLVWLVGQALAVFPQWLLGQKGNKLREPHVFALVKSKCYQDNGAKCCTKPGHSCLRRVFDMSAGPYRRAWLTAGRGARGVVKACAEPIELFSLHDLLPHVKRAVNSLTAPPTSSCSRCSSSITGLQLVAADIDQAYEACEAASVMEAWEALSWVYRAKHQKTSILVARRGRDATQVPNGVLQLRLALYSTAAPILCCVCLHVSYSGHCLRLGIPDEGASNRRCDVDSGLIYFTLP